MSLANGAVEGETIACPFRGSKFDLNSGENPDWVTGFLGVTIQEWSLHLLETGKRPRAPFRWWLKTENST